MSVASGLFNSIVFLVCACTALQLDIDTDKAVSQIPRHFLSLGSSPKIPIHDHKTFQQLQTSERFLSLVRGLSPAYWRFGGQEAQRLTFRHEQADCPRKDTNTRRNGIGVDTVQSRQWALCLTAGLFDEIYRLVVKTNNLILFDLNNVERCQNGSWDHRNVWQLINYTTAMGYNVNWQLGNEPYSYFRHFNVSVDPEQLVEDFRTLRKFIGAKQVAVGPELANPNPQRSLPEAISRQSYFIRWVDGGGEEFVNATSWHFYYFHEIRLTLGDMYSPGALDKLLDAIDVIQSASKGHQSDYWLSETGNVIGRYAERQFTDSYVAGFMWLHKLGIAARTGHTIVCHENLISISRGFLDPSLYPQPTYWISYLFKHLVGNGVLNVEGQLQKGRTVHAFAFCTHLSDPAVNRSYEAGDITLVVINLQSEEAKLDLPSHLLHTEVDVYHLTPGNESLTSYSVLLNGKKLELGGDHQLPVVAAVEQDGSKTITLPPLTYGFYVIRSAKAAACL